MFKRTKIETVVLVVIVVGVLLAIISIIANATVKPVKITDRDIKKMFTVTAITPSNAPKVLKGLSKVSTYKGNNVILVSLKSAREQLMVYAKAKKNSDKAVEAITSASFYYSFAYALYHNK